MDEDSIHKMTSAGDLASHNNDKNMTTLLGIVMSARLVHLKQSRSTEVLRASALGGNHHQMETKDVGSEEGGPDDDETTPEFVISSGIIFGGKATHQKRGSITSTGLPN